MGQKQETVSLAWCDNGNVDGLFMLGVTDVLLQSGIKFVSTIRSQGNQIARQRDRLINHWYDSNKADWLLWVDSDVVISPETFRILWANKDRLARPMITGVYFTSDNPEEPLMIPLPTLFMFEDDKETDRFYAPKYLLTHSSQWLNNQVTSQAAVHENFHHSQLNLRRGKHLDYLLPNLFHA